MMIDIELDLGKVKFCLAPNISSVSLHPTHVRSLLLKTVTKLQEQGPSPRSQGAAAAGRVATLPTSQNVFPRPSQQADLSGEKF